MIVRTPSVRARLTGSRPDGLFRPLPLLLNGWNGEGDRPVKGHGELSAMMDQIHGFTVADQGVRRVLLCDLDLDPAALPAEGEGQPVQCRRQPRREAQLTAVVAHPAEARDQRDPGAGQGGDVQTRCRYCSADCPGPSGRLRPGSRRRGRVDPTSAAITAWVQADSDESRTVNGS